jgi:PAS domain S-box-containing protein
VDDGPTSSESHDQADRLTSVYRLLLEASADMVAVLDRNGTYVLANRAYREFHGIEGDLSGRTVERVLGATLWETEIRAQVERCLTSGSARFRSHRHHPVLGPRVLETAYDRIEDPSAEGLIVAVLRDISREVQEDHHYRLLFQSSRTGLVIVDRDGRILDANPAFGEIVGRKRDGLMTLPMREIMPDDAFCEADEITRLRVFAAPYAAEWDSALLHASGSRRQVQVTAWLVRSGARDDARMMLQIRDVTELRESENRYQRLVENAQEGIWVIDENAVTVFANPAIGRMLGHDHREMVGCPLFSFFDEELEPAVRNRLERHADGASTQFDFVFNHAAGHKVFTTMAVSPVVDADRGYRGAIAGVIDVTEARASRIQSEAIRKLSELFLSDASLHRILRETARILAETLDYPSVAVEAFDPERQVMRFLSAHGVPGFDPDQVFEIPADAGPSGTVARTGESMAENDFAARWSVPDARFSDVAPTTFVCAPIPGREPCFGVISLADPKPRACLRTELNALEIIASHLGSEIARRRAVEDLRESERVYTGLVSNLSGMVYRCANEPGWPMTVLDGAVQEITGHPSVSFYRGGRFTYGDLIAEEDREMVWSTVQTAVDNRTSFEIEYRIVRSDGSIRWLWEQGAGVFDDEGELRFLEGFITDVTQRRQAEERLSESQEQLRQAQKLESIGQLAGGVAHDFNNILQSIFGDVDLADVARAGDRDVGVYLQSIRQNAERASKLTNQLLALGRRQVLSLQHLHVNQVIREHSVMVRRLIGEHIHLDVDGADDVVVHADRGQLEQVLLNLVINARDAMPDGGFLSIRCDQRRVDPDEAAVLGLADPGAHAVIAIQDTGLGIPEEIRDRIFEPFFTTKPVGQGTGLGLATAYGIIRQHGA